MIVIFCGVYCFLLVYDLTLVDLFWIMMTCREMNLGVLLSSSLPYLSTTHSAISRSR